jgi:hypothetical protein
MKRTVLVLVGVTCVLAVGCKTRKESPDFERRFAEAKKTSGLSDVQIIDTSGAGDLKGNVQRLGAPTPPPTAGDLRKLPIKLTQNQVGIYIRRQLARLTGCQQHARGKSGKALLTVKIQSSGRVSSVLVDAPAFSGTKLSRCLRAGAMRWHFPRFRKGPLSYSYPFIFR